MTKYAENLDRLLCLQRNIFDFFMLIFIVVIKCYYLSDNNFKH